ncbi:zinc-binding dehydrogenase [Nocardia sp. NPDC004068]|uniref:zinc-binding dehydrogenase n=1 Tax=Nocardia sp. NPDC004068 TaxID=3364303 RepID=UPI0036B3E93A
MDMRAVVLGRFGEPKEVLAAAEWPVPEPGPGQVRVLTSLSPIHNHDLAIVRGVYGYRPELPAIPGTEAVGRIDAVGPGVFDVEVGQRVAVAGAQGTWAEYFLAEAAAVAPVPESVDDETASQLVSMPFSALLLLEDLGVERGQWIAVNAAGGAVGRLLNLLAERRGVGVVSLVRSEASAEALRAAGFGPVVVTEQAGWQERVAEATGGEPIVAAVDQVGGAAAGELMELLAERGELISFGALSGRPMLIGSGPVIFKQAVVKGFWAARRGEEIGAEARGRLFAELFNLAAGGVLRMGIETSFPLADIGEAVTAAERPGRTAKVALSPRAG